MIHHGEVSTTDEAGCDWELTYEYDGDLTPVSWKQGGFETTVVPAVIESKLCDMAYENERERQNYGSIYRD